MAYQAKLIEEGSWHIFSEPFHFFHIHIKMWQSNEDQTRLHKESYSPDNTQRNSYQFPNSFV